MAITSKNKKRGFALLVAVVFVSVMLALSTAVSSLGYKQQVLSSSAWRSQYAFYAANSALECALLDVERLGHGDPYLFENYLFAYGAVPTCGGLTTEADFPIEEICHDQPTCSHKRITRKRFEIAFDTRPIQSAGRGQLCADVYVYEDEGKAPLSTFVYSQGYDAPCDHVDSNPRLVTRSLRGNF